MSGDVKMIVKVVRSWWPHVNSLFFPNVFEGAIWAYLNGSDQTLLLYAGFWFVSVGNNRAAQQVARSAHLVVSGAISVASRGEVRGRSIIR